MLKKTVIMYHLPELEKDDSSNAPFPSCVSQIPNVIQHSRIVQVNSDPYKQSPCKASSEMPVSAGHIPALTSNRAGCATFPWQVQLGTRMQIQCLMPGVRATSAFRGNFDNQTSYHQKGLLTQCSVYFPFITFHFILKLILDFRYMTAQILNGVC